MGTLVVGASRQLPPFPTLQPALSRVAGVQYTPYSGAPGAWATVRIRGVANVTGNSQPLYVVDGVPLYYLEVTPEAALGQTTNFNAGPYGRLIQTPRTPTANPLLDLPVEEVAAVEVLKGAAATARYGAQGTNGVILITTRRGGDGQATPQPLRVRYAGWAGVQQVRQRYALLDARSYAAVVNQAASNHNQPLPYTATDLASLGEADWQDQVFRVAGIQSHHVSLDGHAARTRYYVAADHLRQTGVVQDSRLRRSHLRANLEHQLTDKLRVGLTTTAGRVDQHYAGTDLDAGRALRDALLAPPAVWAGTPARLPYATDPLANFHFNARTARTQRLLSQLSATYQFSTGLSLSVRGSREQAEAEEQTYSPDAPTLNQVTQAVETGTATTFVRAWVAETVLRYQHTWADRHALTATLTYLRQQFEQHQDTREYTAFYQSQMGLGLESPGIHRPAVSFGYTYAGRYEVQGSVRSEPDGTAPERFWLPGGQVSWHLHKERFLAGATGLSDLTLWAGAGQTSTFFSTDRTTHHDIGLRLGTLGGRLTLEAGAYQRRTRHAQALLQAPLPWTTGSNFAYVRPDITLLNRGLELTLGSTWHLGPLTGTTHLAATTTRNHVEDIGPERSFGTILFSGSTPVLSALIGSSSVSAPGLEKGRPVSHFSVAEQNGTYPSGSARAGEARFHDRDGNGQPDASYQGTGLPRHTLTLYQQLRRHRLGLEAQLDGLFGYQLLNPTLAALDAPTGRTNSSVRALDYWTSTHQHTSVPRPGAPAALLSDQALASGNHVRLSQLTLSYDVLTAGARQASVWVGGQNLFVTGSYRGFDPSVSSGGAAPLHAGQDTSVYPVARVWQVGVRGQF